MIVEELILQIRESLSGLEAEIANIRADLNTLESELKNEEVLD